MLIINRCQKLLPLIVIKPILRVLVCRVNEEEQCRCTKYRRALLIKDLRN